MVDGADFTPPRNTARIMMYANIYRYYWRFAHPHFVVIRPDEPVELDGFHVLLAGWAGLRVEPHAERLGFLGRRRCSHDRRRVEHDRQADRRSR